MNVLGKKQRNVLCGVEKENILSFKKYLALLPDRLMSNAAPGVIMNKISKADNVVNGKKNA